MAKSWEYHRIERWREDILQLGCTKPCNDGGIIFTMVMTTILIRTRIVKVNSEHDNDVNVDT